MNAKQEFEVVGSRPVRPDGLDKVTGRARYGADLNMQDQVYGHILRSPHAHARITQIDCSQALAMPGVLAVMTGDDLPEPGGRVLGSGEGAIALRDLTPMVMSQGKVLFHAQPVAAVAATTPELAAEAAAAIVVSYDVLPAVTLTQPRLNRTRVTPLEFTRVSSAVIVCPAGSVPRSFDVGSKPARSLEFTTTLYVVPAPPDGAAADDAAFSVVAALGVSYQRKAVKPSWCAPPTVSA